MKQKQTSPRSRYFILYLCDGEYKYESGDDRLDVQQVLAYYLNRDDVVVPGTYDPQDWSFEWQKGIGLISLNDPVDTTTAQGRVAVPDFCQLGKPVKLIYLLVFMLFIS